MTIPEVLDKLALFLQDSVKEYLADKPSSEGGESIAVYSGYPPVRIGSNPTPSFICCLAENFNDSEDGGALTVRILFSIYCPDETDPARPLYNLVEHCRQNMLKKRLLAGRAQLQLPLKGEFELEQAGPQYQADITAVYTIGHPTEEEFDYDGFQETKAYSRY